MDLNERGEEIIRLIFDQLTNSIKKENELNREMKEEEKESTCCDDCYSENCTDEKDTDRVFIPYNTYKDEKNGATFIFNVAGFSKDEILVEYKQGMIRVSTHFVKPRIARNLIGEDYIGICKEGETVVELPREIFDNSKITSNLSNGLLTIKVPRSKDSIARKIVINTDKD